MISVVIPLFNKQNSIRSTIDSVLDQSFQDFEIIIVDDGSTDCSTELVRRYKDPRIRLISKENGGVSSARNEGIKKAQSDHIAFLDADDIWQPEYLSEINRLAQDFPQAGLLGTSYSCLKDGSLSTENKPLPVDYYGIIDNSKWEYPHLFWTSAVCCRKDILEKIGMFDERISIGEDIDVWWRILLHSEAAYSNKSLAVYRFDEENRAMNGSIPLEKHYIYYFEKYKEYRKKDLNFRHFIDKECMWWLYPYTLDKDTDEKEIKRILEEIDLSEYKASFRFRFMFPKLYKILHG